MRKWLVILPLFMFSGIYSYSQETNFIPFDYPSGNCLSEEQRTNIKANLQENITILTNEGYFIGCVDRAAVSFEHPLELTNDIEGSGYYGISNFVDHNADFPDFVSDYNCGNRSYDNGEGYNHSGTDFFLWPFGWKMMNENAVRVIASAPGIIIGKEDGNDDKNCLFTPTNDWNAVYIQHVDGSQAWYGHLKKHSLTDKIIGDSVLVGEYLGLVGSSGSSSGPHLHFEVYNDQGGLVDPYFGTCNDLNEESWWASQKPYYNSTVNRLSTNKTLPEFRECPNQTITNESTLFCGGDTVVFMAYLRDQLEFQSLIHQIIRPDNSVFAQWTNGLEGIDHYSASYTYQSLILPSAPMEGDWMYKVIYSGESFEHLFMICQTAQVDGPYPEKGRMTLFPNPTHGSLYVTYQLPEDDYKIRLTNVYGKSCPYELTKVSALSQEKYLMRLQDLATGLYFVSLIDSENKIVSTEKIVYQNN